MDTVQASDIKINLSLRQDSVVPTVKIPGRDNGPSKKTFVKLSIINVSKEVVAIHVPMWFTELHVESDGKKIDYIGPVASLPPPQESDIKKLQPDASFEQEVELSSYYQLPVNTGSEIVIEYTHEISGAKAQARFRQP